MNVYIPETYHFYAMKVLAVNAKDEESVRMTVIKAKNKEAAMNTFVYILRLDGLQIKHVSNVASFDDETGAEWQVEQWGKNDHR